MTTPTKDAQVVPLLPLHAVADGGVNRPRGRPQKVERAPSRADLEHHAKVAQEQTEHVEQDEIVRAVADGRDPVDVLKKTAAALAREAAVLEHQRRQLELRGRDVGQLVSRRANILVQLTKLQIQVQEANPQLLDLRSEAMKIVFTEWLAKLAEVAQEVLTDQQYDVFFVRLESAFEGWEDDTESKLR